MKVNRRKIECMCVDERRDNGAVRMKGGGENGWFQIPGLNCAK